MKAPDEPLPADVALAMMLHAADGAIERHGRYEQRMQRTIHRCLRELRQHRKDQGTILADLPDSPFLDDDSDDENVDPPPTPTDEQNHSSENEATDRTAADSDTPFGGSQTAVAAPDAPARDAIKPRTPFNDANRPQPDVGQERPSCRKPKIAEIDENEPKLPPAHLLAPDEPNV
jgi:hypothetical protein